MMQGGWKRERQEEAQVPRWAESAEVGQGRRQTKNQVKDETIGQYKNENV